MQRRSKAKYSRLCKLSPLLSALQVSFNDHQFPGNLEERKPQIVDKARDSFFRKELTMDCCPEAQLASFLTRKGWHDLS